MVWWWTAAHREVEAPVAALDGLLAVLRPAQIQVDELVAEGLLSHVLILLPVYRAHEVALLLETLGEVGGDEAAGAGHADLELRVALGELLLGHGRQNLRGEATRVGMLARHPVLVPARPRKCAQADRTPVRVRRVSRTGANVAWQAFVNRHAPWCRWVRLSHKSGRADKLRLAGSPSVVSRKRRGKLRTRSGMLAEGVLVSSSGNFKGAYS